MIQISGLSKTYRTGFFMMPKVALTGIDLQVNEGEIFGFIGPNGAGKSTTIKILTGLLRPSAGHARVLGYPCSEVRSRRELGYLPEHPYFYDYLTGYELLRFFGALSGVRGSLLEERIRWSLDLLHANHDWIHRRLRTYSKGMMQRVGLAQAVLAKPRLLILDEPMSGLDPLGRRDVREAILSLNKEGCTVFYSSHVLADVESISHRVAMVVDGRIVRYGTVEEVTGGESSAYRVRTSQPLHGVPHVPGLTSEHPQEFFCENASSRDAFLGYCLAQGLGIERVENFRPSLEEVLTREVSREGVHG